MTEPTKELDGKALARWRARMRARRQADPKRFTRHVVTLSPTAVSDEGGTVVGDSVEWDTPAPTFIRSGSAADVYWKTVKRLRDGWDARVKLMEEIPGVRVNIPDAERDEWIRNMAEASNRRVYADVKPVRSDLAEIVRKHGDAE